MSKLFGNLSFDDYANDIFCIPTQYVAYTVNHSKTSVQATIDMFITMISQEL